MNVNQNGKDLMFRTSFSDIGTTSTR